MASASLPRGGARQLPPLLVLVLVLVLVLAALPRDQSPGFPCEAFPALLRGFGLGLGLGLGLCLGFDFELGLGSIRF